LENKPKAKLPHERPGVRWEDIIKIGFK